MNTRRLLVFLPLVLLALLFQSALWVPTYGSQGRGNPRRLTTFVEASIGEPKILNPMLASEAAASEVYGRRIFEGLLDTDEHLNLKPRLAERWELTEEAYLAAIPERTLPDGRAATAAALLEALQSALAAGRLGALKGAIVGLEIVPPSERAISETVARPGKKGKPEPYEITGSIALPERVKLRLTRVLPELFTQLAPVLGAGYFEHYPFEKNYHLQKPEDIAELRPLFAEQFPIGEHNPVITFYVRHGVRFHDGVPLTAKDVKFTYEAIVDPRNASPRASSFDIIRELELVDDYTVRVVYKRLFSPALSEWGMEIVPEHLLNRAAIEREMDRRHLSAETRKNFTLRNTDFNRAPIGTGPFRFVEWRAEEYIHQTRNEDYWGQKPEYRDIYTRVIPDYVTQELELHAGAIDAYSPLPHQAARYRHDPRYHTMAGSEGMYTYIGYNLRKPLFQDVRVRRALGMAINVDDMIKYVLSGEGQRTNGPYYSNTPYYDASAPLLPYDPKGAEALLAEAGWKKNAAGRLEKDGKPFEFTLITNNGNVARKAIMTIAQAAWEKLGVHCTTQSFEWTVFITDFIDPNQFDAYVLGWVGGDNNPDKYQIWHSSQTDPYELNHVGYKSDRADRLIERIREEYDRDKQIAMARELHRLIAEDQPYTFLYEPTKPYVLDKKIVVVDRAPDGSEKYSKIIPSPGGEIGYYFDKWRKLPALPALLEP